MRKHTMGAAIALSLALASTASADSNIQSLTGEWSPSNSTVIKTADGVHFGTYADGGALRAACTTTAPTATRCQR